MVSVEGRRSPSPTRLLLGTTAEELRHDGFCSTKAASTSTPRRHSRPASAATAGFQQFPDYARINGERHNTHKNDTFATPAPLSERCLNSGVRGTKRELYEVCDYSVRRCLSSLSQEIMRDIRQEAQQSLDLLRKESAAAAEAKEAIESEKNTLLTQIHEIVHDGRVDFNKMQNDIRSGEIVMLDSHRDQIMRVEGKLLESLGQVRNELQDVRRAQEEAEESMLARFRELTMPDRIDAMPDEFGNQTSMRSFVGSNTLGQQSAQHIEHVFNMQKSLTTYVIQNQKEIQKLQEEQEKQRCEICRDVADQLAAQLKTTMTQSDGAQVIGVVKKVHTSVASDFKQILNEISTIQKAMNLDFARVMEELDAVASTTAEGFKCTSDSVKDSLKLTNETLEETAKNFKKNRRPDAGLSLTSLEQNMMQRSTVSSVDPPVSTRMKKRIRDFSTQTDHGAPREVWTQTEEITKKKKTEKRKMRTTYQASIKRKGAAAQAAEKAKDAKPVFADAEAMRAKVRQALIKPQYNVLDFYHVSGCAQCIAKSSWFENLTFFVIFLNAIWIAVDMDRNDAVVLFEAHPIFQIAENSFCAYFTTEVTIRFLAFRKKKYCCQDFWFVFDFFLVLLMVGETWVFTAIVYWGNRGASAGLGNASILRMVRMIKMIRISRMARLLRAIPELVILLKGIVAAARAVLVFFVLWLIIIYVFAVVFRQLTQGEAVGDMYFASVPDAMNTLLLRGILPGFADWVTDVSGDQPFLWPLVIFFILLASVTLMYMLIGVLVDVVSVIASTEKEGMTVVALASQLRAAWEVMDRDTSTAISKSDFQNLLTEPQIVSISQDCGVDVVMLVDNSDVIFEDYDEKLGKSMSFEDFVEIMLKMRGTNQATVKDVKELFKSTRSVMRSAHDHILKKIGEEFTGLRDEISQQAERHMEHMEQLRELAESSSSSDSDEGGHFLTAATTAFMQGDEYDD